MMRETTVFGPIFSRRLGSSLGINLLPQGGKVCNFDCIYCECGWNADGRGDRVLPTAEDVRKALTEKLVACHEAGVPIDSITFSGDGEPTLNPDFPEVPLGELLTWASRNGAEFLAKPEFGTLEPGKRPGLVFIDNLDADGRMTAASKSRRL